MSTAGSLLNRPKSYFNVDGIGELGIGFMCLSFALLSWQQVRTDEHSIWNQFYTLYIYMGAVVAIIHYGTKAFKERVTFPRTGRVEYRNSDKVWKPMIYGFVFSAAAILIVVLFLKSHWDLATPVSLFGLVLAATYARNIAESARWKWSVVWVMSLVSIAIAVLPRNLLGAMADHSWITRQVPAALVGAAWLTMTSYGTLLLVSGAITLWTYLHNTSAPSDEAR